MQALAPTITSLLPYKLALIESYLLIESILKSETQTPITLTDMSQSSNLPPAPMEDAAPLANSTPPVIINTSQKEVKMNMPTLFIGDRKKLEEFLIETDMYLTMKNEMYNNNQRKIIFILSFMKDRKAGPWKQSFWT